MSKFRQKLQQLKVAQDSIQDLQALLEVSKRLHATVDVGQLFPLIVNKAIALTRADRGCLMVVRDGDFHIEVARDREGGCLPQDQFRVSHTIVRSVIAHKQALTRPDAWDDEALADQTSVRDLSIRMVLAAPLLIEGEVVGLIYVDSANPGEAMSEQRLQTLEALAGQSAVAFQQALLYGEIETLYQKTKILDRAKLDFIQIASHELRTPLALIQGYAAILPEMEEVTDETRKIFQGILDGTNRLAGIVDLMLLAGEIDQQGLQLQIYDYSLRDLVAQEVDVWQQAIAQDRCLELRVEVEDGPLLWPVDPGRLKMAISHLIQNAIKFTPDGGTVTVTLRRRAEDIQIDVRDTGIGIAAEHQGAIFEKFYRVGDVGHHSSGRTKFMGAGPGLGLYLTRSIVEAHGGKVWVESKNGAGSRFVVRLPAAGR